MEKRKLSGKTILKLVGALVALAYLGFCLYAGITGKFPNMHRAEHVMRFGDLKNWVSGGMSAVMIFAFCNPRLSSRQGGSAWNCPYKNIERPACGAWVDAETACGAEAPLQVCVGQL